MAEVYHIYNYHTLPARTLATLVAGLRAGSRVKTALSGLPSAFTYEEFLLARISDSLQFLCWAQTKDGQKNRNKPESIVSKMMGDVSRQKENEIATFDSPEAFERAKKNVLRR